MCINVKNIFERFKKDFHKTTLFNRGDLILRIALVFVIFGVFLSQLDKMYEIPLNKPYYTGTWDEPFSINAGINVLHQKGDPVFYNYGGTSAYPYSLVFYRYCKTNGIVPSYKHMDKELKVPDWPLTRKIYPVKPIYITKIIAYILFLIGAFLFVALFSFLLLPVPFLLIPLVTSSKTFSLYANQMLPEIHIGLLAGLTSLFFAKAVIEKDTSRYFLWVVTCSVLASLTAAAKINAIYILILPISLVWRLFKEKYLTIKRLAVTAAGFIFPYVLLNPAIIFNFEGYKAWLSSMNELSGINPGFWMKRLSTILSFIKELHLVELFPAVLLILLFILTCILMVKKNPAAFLGFMFFFLYSLYTIANMKHMLYTRHFVFLILPFNLLILFPLIYLFDKVPKSLKASLTLLCLLVTLWVFPPGRIAAGIGKLGTGEFSTQWEKESRDELMEFVKSTGARLYFYDYHGFSLPNNIHDRIIPFSTVADLPDKLKQNEYMALVLYKKKEKGLVNWRGKYRKDLGDLLKKYKPVKIFGKPGGRHDINKQAPLRNPTIVLLKEK